MIPPVLAGAPGSASMTSSGSGRWKPSRRITWLFLIPALLLGALSGDAKDSTAAADSSKAQGKRSWKSENGQISFQHDLSQWDFFRRGNGGFMAAHKKQDLMLIAVSQPLDPRRSVPEFAAVFKKSFEESARKHGGSARLKWIKEPIKEYGTYPYTVEYETPSPTKLCYGRVFVQTNAFCMVQLSGNTADAAARKDAMLFEKAVTFLGATE